MRLILALGAAAAATTMIAYAQTEAPRARDHVVIRHGGGVQIDADDDGWITRAESSAGADRMFAELDRNDDGRLDETDRPPMPEFNVHIEGPHGGPHGDDNCTRTETEVDGGRRVTVICDDEREEGSERRTETRRHVEVETRQNGDVIVRREGDPMVAPPIPPVPPLPPAPMFMMMLGEDSEADVNNDGAISQDEFRNMHLRLFDAHDVNGDGRVRAHRMPEPPTPPNPPTPPSPPARRG